MKLILDTLEAARLAASPSDALALADAIADLDDISDALDDLDLSEVPSALVDFKALRDHVAAQPFESCGEADGTTTVEDLTPGAFAEWLATLERLAS
jgi:hypothetical protein